MECRFNKEYTLPNKANQLSLNKLSKYPDLPYNSDTTYSTQQVHFQDLY